MNEHNQKKPGILRTSITHAFEQPFILATGLAALAHSTWTLGTLFTGLEPEPFTLDWLWWVLPAFLIAFALDVGQIATSADIRNNGGSTSKYTTFAVFAVATYYLQWAYMMHHIPNLALGEGVRAEWIPFVELMRDVAIFTIPALLPLATLLYTFSSDKQKLTDITPSLQTSLQITTEDLPALSDKSSVVTSESSKQSSLFVDGVLSVSETLHIAKCELCDFESVYDSLATAKRAIGTHKRSHKNDNSNEVIEVSTEGSNDMIQEQPVPSLNGHSKGE